MATEIDVFSDFVCPWCLIGTHRLERVLDDLALTESTVIRYRPFMLDPNTPSEGRSVPEELRRKYGRDPAPMFKHVETEARASGIRLDLAKQPLMLPTVRAHTLMRHTAVVHQHAFAKDLFESYFLEGENIHDLMMLAELALPHGHTTVEVARLCEDEHELAQTKREAEMPARMGIHGAPFFIINSTLAISGAQPEDVFRRALQQSGAAADAS
ncbi:MAG: DsbA family oxidoreductase [Deltaproteobacteria bacterium]|nr:DsbA family oxidoreductase [Deltaproteobacteria bacterium]